MQDPDCRWEGLTYYKEKLLGYMLHGAGGGAVAAGGHAVCIGIGDFALGATGFARRGYPSCSLSYYPEPRCSAVLRAFVVTLDDGDELEPGAHGRESCSERESDVQLGHIQLCDRKHHHVLVRVPGRLRDASFRHRRSALGVLLTLSRKK